MKNFILLISIFFICSCSAKKPIDNVRIQESKPFNNEKIHAVMDIKVKDFLKLDYRTDKIPEGLPVTLNLLQPVTLNEFFQFLIAQGISIVADLQEQGEKLISVPNYNGELKDLLKTVQNSHGLFFDYKNNILTVKTKSPVYVKVMMPGTDQELISLLASFGVEKSYYDKLSSRIVFVSDYFTYKKIDDYFKNNAYLTLVLLDVMILEKQQESELSHGVDWSQLSLALSDTASNGLSTAIAGSTSGLFNIELNADFLSLTSVVRSLDELKTFDVAQSARLSALNGSSCTLDASEKIPYVKSIEIQPVEGTDKTTTGYEFGEISSGLVLNIVPSVVDNIVSLNFKADIQSVNDFLEVGSEGNLVSQPVTTTRNIQNQVISKAGQITLIGGLKYKKTGFTKSSLSWSESGFKTKEAKNFLVSIIIKSQVVRYVFV